MAITKKKTDLCKLWGDVISGKRKLPKDETIWLSNPKFAFLYAKYFRKSRWSEKHEVCFYGDVKALYNYFYWLKNDLKESLSEHLHNFMLMKVLDSDNGEKEWVDLYFKDVENESIKK